MLPSLFLEPSTPSLQVRPQQSKRKDNKPHVGNSMIILTGANFFGKSVYLKQVATIIILAQLGSFVPAEEAHIGIHDAIFTRVLTTKSASHSSSAFMIDLQRVSFTVPIPQSDVSHSSDLHSLDEPARQVNMLGSLSNQMTRRTCPPDLWELVGQARPIYGRPVLSD
ncbi:hypothetical protein PCASD_18485 [Puccinia coronata f. sp. avenae]|uniref:DNA mismatch repair proteins mutS family domain-containing protein n=1 Tax=Puccinia coronata f. sp. avenae TaxID=200324 RepID=A0A2N5SVU3_9BASI|nr:hypothetical protein PCASD_18485 [Puccinia coronata f. sp. avenae]